MTKMTEFLKKELEAKKIANQRIELIKCNKDAQLVHVYHLPEMERIVTPGTFYAPASDRFRWFLHNSTDDYQQFYIPLFQPILLLSIEDASIRGRAGLTYFVFLHETRKLVFREQDYKFWSSFYKVKNL